MVVDLGAGATRPGAVRAGMDRLNDKVPLASREGIAGIILLLVLLLLTRPYQGIVHDAHLYAVQALHRIDGRFLGEDLFFRFGNQDSFSLFTRVYAPVIERLGIGWAHAVFWIVGLIVWLCGLIALGRAIYGPTHLAFAAAAAVILLNPGYGNQVLSYGENFVSARLFAEAFAMLAAAALLGRKYLQAVLLSVLAAAIHPITGLLFGAFLLWLFLQDWRKFLVIGALGAIVVLVMAWLGLPPFVWIAERYDDTWLALVRKYSSMVFILEWNPAAFLSGIMLPFATLIIVATRQDIRFARLATAAIIVPLTLSLCAIFAAYALENKFLSALQLWRALLILQLFGNLFALKAVLSLRPGFARSRTLITIALFYCVFEGMTGGTTVGSAFISLAALVAYLFERGRNGVRAGFSIRVVTDLMVIAAIVLTLPISIGNPILVWETEAQLKFIFRVLVAGIAVWAMFLSGAGLPFRRKLVLTLICAAASLIMIDDRSKLQKYVEASVPVDPEFAGKLRGRTVYWEDGLSILWFKLGVPSFYSCRQMGGIAFFRDQALEFERRAAGLRVLNTNDFVTDPASSCPRTADPDQRGPETPAQIRSACQSLPELDLLVLRSARPDGYSGFVELPVPSYAPLQKEKVFEKPMIESENTRYYLYDCENFRS